MPNVNIVSTPNIEGNVSSCKTELTVINGAKRNSLWWSEDVGYATNNCTGQTDIYTSWSLTGFSGVVIGFGCVLTVVIVIMLMVTMDSY